MSLEMEECPVCEEMEATVVSRRGLGGVGRMCELCYLSELSEDEENE